MIEVEDETHFMQLGQTTTAEYWSIEYKSLRPSSSNLWPNKYKFIGIEIIFNPDLMLVDRQTYDTLTFLADVGGLDFSLYIFGFLLMNSYSQFNAYTHLISLLFLKSNPEFQGQRNIMKEPKEYDSDDGSESLERKNSSKATGGGRESIFERFYRNTLLSNMLQDFETRTKINRPTISEIIGGWLCRCRRYRRFRKFYTNGQRRVDQDLDMIRVLKIHRRHAIELWSLMKRNQH